ncbi:putative dtdp-glucose 4,6-dehydratase [Scheffersomyces amazonensis]|uniref:putative dtdp-glucose 4,6-dehydratase n=1 Tax=Scheffersomyces amazonensis TaxID=1078765 RepID=UPI00315D3352
MTKAYDRYVLVTGGAGFIGSNFLNYFVAAYPNYYFICIDKLNYSSNSSTKNIRSIISKTNFKFIKLDLAESFDELYQLIVTNNEQYPITDIVNFAAESSVDKSFESPLYFTRNNILSTQNLLECYRLLKESNSNIKINFLHISTDEVYGDSNIDAVEYGTLRPTNPYSASKAAIDLIISSYQYSYKLPICIIRPNNIYGPYQYPDKLVSLTLNCLKNNKNIPLHGNGSNKRCYLHVRDFLEGLELIWTKGDMDGTYNIGSEFEIDNYSAVKLICEAFIGSNKGLGERISFVPDRNYNDLRYSINCDKMKSLGWEPKIEFRAGIENLIENFYESL